jgi:predicted nucleic acid-binding protein
LNLILDASSTINLHRGGVFEVVLGLTSFAFVFRLGYIVRGECGDLQGFLDSQAIDGRLVMIPDNTLTPQEFTEILNFYELGSGETECIALAKQLGLSVCTDDRAARRAVIAHLGADRVIGSLRLIRECVCRSLLTVQDACLAYESMKAGGAFLPPVPVSYFEC